MIAGDHGCHPEWRRFSLADRDLRIGQDGAKRMGFSESEVSQMQTVQVSPAPSQVALAAYQEKVETQVSKWRHRYSAVLRQNKRAP